MGAPGIGHMGGVSMQQQRMMGNIQQQQQQGMMGAQMMRMGQQGMMGGQQQRMAGPGMHLQGMMGAQQQRMGMPGVSQQGMMGSQHPRMASPVVSQQGMMGAQQQRMASPVVSQKGMMGAQQQRMGMPGVSQQGMMGAQQQRMGMPGVSQQGMMGAQHPRMASPMVSQQGMMGAQQQRMASPVVSQQGMMGSQQQRMAAPMVRQQGMMGAQHQRMMGQGMMGNQQQRMLRPGMSQQSMMGTAQQRMMGSTAQNCGIGPRVNQQLMMQGQQQRMMGPVVSQQSMMEMRQQRIMSINQQRSVGPGQMQQGMMGAQQHGSQFPQQSMMGTTGGSHLGAQQQRIMVTIMPEQGAVGPASQRIVESTHGVSERQVIEINTENDAIMDDRREKQNGVTRSNNVNIVISPQEDLPHYSAPSSTANTLSPRASTLRTLVEVPLSFDTEVSEKQTFTKDVDHRLLKPDLDPGILKDGDVDYRTLVPIRPAEDGDQNVLETQPDKPSPKKDIPLKLLVKLKPLKPLPKTHPPGETLMAEPKTDPENSLPNKDSTDPPKPGLVPVPSKGSASKSKITLKLIDRGAKQKRTKENSHGSIPTLLENSMLSLNMEPTQQEILSALEEDCGCMNLFSSPVEQKTTERTEVTNSETMTLLSISAPSAADKMGLVQEGVEAKVDSSQREEEKDMPKTPEVVGVTSVPGTKSGMGPTSEERNNDFSNSNSGKTKELSENHNLGLKPDESEDDLKENLPLQTHSKGPLKSFPLALQDKEERQARDDELIQTSLDAMVEPSEVQNIAISFKNPIAEAFEPNKPGSPLLSLALKLTRLHKQNVTKSYNGKHLRRTISMIEEGMENRSRFMGVKQKNNAGKELRLVISRVFTKKEESGPDVTEHPGNKNSSQRSQDSRTVVVSEEVTKTEDARISTSQDTCTEDLENHLTPVNNNLAKVKEEREYSQTGNTTKNCSTSPKRKAVSEEDHPLPRKVARSNSTPMCSNAKPGTVHVKQEGETTNSLSKDARNLFNMFSESMNSPKDLQSRNSNSHVAVTGGFSNVRVKVQSSDSLNHVVTVDNPETCSHDSQASMSKSPEGSEVKVQQDKAVANHTKDRIKCNRQETPDCNTQRDGKFKKEPTVHVTGASSCNNLDLLGEMSQENCKKGSQETTLERTSRSQTEDWRISTCSSFSGGQVEANAVNKNLHSTSQSNQRLDVPKLHSTVKRESSSEQGTVTVAESPGLQPSSVPNCHNISNRLGPPNTDFNSITTENKGSYNHTNSASLILNTHNPAQHTISVTLNFPKEEKSSALPTKIVHNLPKRTQSPPTAYSLHNIPVILGRESLTTKIVVSPNTSPPAKTTCVPSELRQEYQCHKSPKTQGKFFRVCGPPGKAKECSRDVNTWQGVRKNGVEGEIQVTVKQEMGTCEVQHEGTASTDVRKVEFSEADCCPEDPSTWPQGISLQAMKHIILVDLGYWPEFFQSIPKGLLADTFVWGFQDAKASWRPPVSCEEYCRLGRKRHFFLHPPCGSTDSVISMVASKLDGYLPRHLPFTLLSGHIGFPQLQQRWKNCRRKANLVNPNTTDLQNHLHHLFSTKDSSTRKS
uniref:ZNF451 PIN-like domain-containing protein n=1 Tax=Branchiostoma floridae TaxID=7739 RepID=C3ZFE5_BRAFL|eukprot:XP_002592688.1 hypothetical protein BRAFLDRAFT_118395 [Branchiostoma floridae]